MKVGLVLVVAGTCGFIWAAMKGVPHEQERRKKVGKYAAQQTRARRYAAGHRKAKSTMEEAV